MVDRAKAWAESKGLTRTNPVHGESEYRVPTQFDFSHIDRESLKTRVSASTKVEARPLLYVHHFHVHDVWPGPSLAVLRLQGGKGLLLGKSADLSADKMALNHDCMWVFLSQVICIFFQRLVTYLRKGSNCANAGLEMAAAAADSAKKGKNKLVFPVLQVGGDPYGDPTNHQNQLFIRVGEQQCQVPFKNTSILPARRLTKLKIWRCTLGNINLSYICCRWLQEKLCEVASDRSKGCLGYKLKQWLYAHLAIYYRLSIFFK